MPHVTARTRWTAAAVAAFVVPASVVTLLTAGQDEPGAAARGQAPVRLQPPAALPVGSVPTSTRVPRLPEKESERKTGVRGTDTTIADPLPTPTPGDGGGSPLNPTPAPTATPGGDGFGDEGGSSG